MVSGGDVEGGTGGGKEGFPEVRGDAGVTVRDDDEGKTFLGEHMINEHVCKVVGIDGLGGADEDSHLG